MKIKQIYTGCLSQGTYYIESNGEVAIIDPLREVQPYINSAKKVGATIKYIFETHFHADFVSGHVTLAKKTGAPIIFGPNAVTNFDAVIAKDGQVFNLGNITITAIHTPGHTMESTIYLLKNKNGKDHAIFSGDTLFLGDVGRPDLAQKNGKITESDLAGFLFDSLRNKIMPLADDIIVYPAHGSGSSCGKNLSKETVGTLGNQKATNYALRADMTKEEFIKEVTYGLSPSPKYFPLNVQMNKEGCEDYQEVLARSFRALDVETFDIVTRSTKAIILDVRHQDEFAKAHIPNSIFVGLAGSFAPWVGAIIANVNQPILLITPLGLEEETIMRLSRVGFDKTLGYLKGGFDTWKNSSKKCASIKSINVLDLRKVKLNMRVSLFDVRKQNEFLLEHVFEAENTPLDSINFNLFTFPSKEIFYVHCASGYRSMIAASLLKRTGIHNFMNVIGGFDAIKNTDMVIS
jgi:glyoxylase-like metal-dependent hydrolase (beta-lactamase superfamily II)/rhodanese-related sulfurtransferase